uniref:Radical SAM protein n=1 Tax=candidate division WOR-3 bacterium TaxID=2052148 RepID=A0A7C4GH01_UNCW3
MDDDGRIRSAAVVTTGCRLNQAESDILRSRLRERNFVIVPQPERADVCYVNTCAVTAAASRTSIQRIRQVCRLRPKPWVVVLGCLAQHERMRVESIEGVDEVWDNLRKRTELADACPFPSRSRAVLKVQDGCDFGCSFCVVSGLRGRPRSVEPELVCRQVDELVSAGYQEIVLTGLNLGQYKSADGRGLPDLLALLLSRSGFRIRLASIEPDGFSERLSEVLAEDRICPHFHVPLQSGDDGVLTLMGRRYKAADYARLLEWLVRLRPEACIGADVIAGFPGESENSFRRTASFLDALPLAYLHAFPYSARSGTKAQTLGDSVSASVKRSRVAVLREYSKERSLEFRRRFVGSVREAVVESYSSATTDNYLHLELERGVSCQPGRLLRLRIVERLGRFFGQPVAVHEPSAIRRYRNIET